MSSSLSGQVERRDRGRARRSRSSPRTARPATATSGNGNREFGAPNLTDAIWLYGGEARDRRAGHAAPRHGVMPAWIGRLGEPRSRSLRSTSIRLAAAKRRRLGLGRKRRPGKPGLVHHVTAYARAVRGNVAAGAGMRTWR